MEARDDEAYTVADPKKQAVRKAAKTHAPNIVHHKLEARRIFRNPLNLPIDFSDKPFRRAC